MVIAGAAVGRHVLKPKLSYGVSKPVVPLRETRWEVSGLPAAHANIPGFDDELCRTDNGVLLHGCKDLVARVEVIAIVSCQGGGKVKAEAIDLELFDPVAEAIEH